MAMFARLGLAMLVVASAACSFGNLDELDSSQCDTPLKMCTIDGKPQCVSSTNIAFGCGNGNCAPCAFKNGEARCGASGKCELSACRVPFQDCNRDLSDGCEADTDADPNTCGPTCTKCEIPNANPTCNAGVCKISSCSQGFRNCNGSELDGCEINILTNPLHCGDCNRQCAEGLTCQAGSCS